MKVFAFCSGRVNKTLVLVVTVISNSAFELFLTFVFQFCPGIWKGGVSAGAVAPSAWQLPGAVVEGGLLWRAALQKQSASHCVE